MKSLFVVSTGIWRLFSLRLAPPVSTHNPLTEMKHFTYRENGVDECVRHDLARGRVEARLGLLVEHPALFDGRGNLQAKPRKKSSKRGRENNKLCE